jgi:hypothetical protein
VVADRAGASTSRACASLARGKLGEKLLHAAVDLVPDDAHVVERPAGGIVELPVEVPLARVRSGKRRHIPS